MPTSKLHFFSVTQSAQDAQQVFAQKGNLPGVVHFLERLNARKALLPPGLANDASRAEEMLQTNSILNKLFFRWQPVNNFFRIKNVENTLASMFFVFLVMLF